MLLRLLFVLLVALNIAVGTWLLLGRDGARAHAAFSLRTVAAQQHPTAPLHPVQATNEQPAPAASARPGAPHSRTTAATRTPHASGYTCLAVGPFLTRDALRSVRQSLGDEAVRSRQREDAIAQSQGWWVHLPAAASHAQALILAQRLGERGVRDYFIVTTGEPRNAISLGLFRDPANARKRRDQAVAQGFAARMSERVETLPAWWLDVVLPNRVDAHWRGQIRALDVSALRTGCF